jgi:hypothetical protein
MYLYVQYQVLPKAQDLTAHAIAATITTRKHLPVRELYSNGRGDETHGHARSP